MSTQGDSHGSQREPLPVLRFGEVEPRLDTHDFVEGLLTRGGLSDVFGEPACRKTFFMTNLGFHVATGRRWWGREVDKCGVVYVAAEGGYGIQNRVAALKMYYDLDEPTARDIPFVVVPCSVDLLRPNADTNRLIELINRETEHFDVRVGLVIIDTLSRALAGGNENSSEDMGALIRNSDRIREQTGAHLCFVHHSGKDASRGGRGWSGVPAAVDTEIEVKRHDNVSVAKVKQQRDLEESEDELSFSLQVVELGTNGRGKPVTSCVVVEAEGQHATTSTTLSPQQRLALDTLDNCLVDLGRHAAARRGHAVGSLSQALLRRPLRNWHNVRCRRRLAGRQGVARVSKRSADGGDGSPFILNFRSEPRSLGD